MDGAYLKFMMCQCLLNRADWGLAIGCTNCVLSFCLFHFWLVELVKSMENYAVKWVVLYGCNVMFNVITMMRIVKRESISVFYWFCGTVAVLIFRIHYLYVDEDDFWLAKRDMYKVCNIVTDVYIFVSLLVMIYVMWGLHLEPDRLYPKEEMVNNCKHDPKEGQEDNEMEKEEQQQDIDMEMDELNEKANQKLASIVELEESFQDRQSIAPTAPEDYGFEEVCEPSAPPESNFSLEIDFNDQIMDDSWPE
ncbi:uncharacterized protein Dana_GF13733, isoform A [Drosophila ananassae]|uniref:Uncharacterized protein, isoform A n=1 Tax=Drosophila ananassae TaxID=7217 RepID=B3MHY6_DROAN|nr:uncharacterized protein LOC6496569 [Drosophila ananassae]EDV37996.1 uncharacterized protein Dana_GF13733, isoform A [Drosophila ananassae]